LLFKRATSDVIFSRKNRPAKNLGEPTGKTI
jgi:hypothetical protein